MERFNRRHVLGVIGAGTLAGCLDTGGLTGSSNGPGESPGNGDDPLESSDPPNDLPSSCPDYGDSVDRVVCYDDLDSEADDAYLEPSVRTVDEGEEIEFTLVNDSAVGLETNFYNWRIDKYVDDEWHRVAPRAVNQPLMRLEPRETHTWTVTIDNDGIEDGEAVGLVGGTSDIDLAGLGAGAYAFRGRGWFEDEGHDEAIAFAATFELEGQTLGLTAMDAVVDTEWEGETLVAHSDRGDPDDEYTTLGAYELEVINNDVLEGVEPEPVITEQLLRQPQLRDTIALAHEYESSIVRLEEYHGTMPIFGRDSDGVYEYQGTYYRVRTEELEE
ncbi:hypothetical protein [Halostagnicola sp. A-GB9-2]|uniref:hypothetical protein n=1 Tax=Halostagnicola sp. A-GB9-2 TaxID=3048066 RepID=UPI0024BF4370|nr:hypothetical protein [Halostagnicola sp. A-GB9-2]MDJ1432543.1 hypothetical protein [Halostagnicola sp. A-GB9-2]